MCRLTKAISRLTHALLEFGEAATENEHGCHGSHSHLVTKQDLKEMECRLNDAIAKHAHITPSVELAAMSVQFALDKLDASIPDKKKYDTTTTDGPA